MIGPFDKQELIEALDRVKFLREPWPDDYRKLREFIDILDHQTVKTDFGRFSESGMIFQRSFRMLGNPDDHLYKKVIIELPWQVVDE